MSSQPVHKDPKNTARSFHLNHSVVLPRGREAPEAYTKMSVPCPPGVLLLLLMYCVAVLPSCLEGARKAPFFHGSVYLIHAQTWQKMPGVRGAQVGSDRDPLQYFPGL